MAMGNCDLPFIIIIIIHCLAPLDSNKPIQKRIYVNHEGLSTPIATYSRSDSRGKEVAWTRNELHQRITDHPSEESHTVTDHLGENSRNPMKKQENRKLKPNQIQ